MSLPSTCRALVCPGFGEGLSLQSIPTPTPVHGSAIVRVLAAAIGPQYRDLFDGKMPFFNTPVPLVPGHSAVGRVAAVGPDATKLQVGQLVLVEPHVRARDDPTVTGLFGLSGGFTPEAQKMMKEVWRDANWTEYSRVPLENCYVLDEKLLLGSPSDGGFGYDAADLPYMAKQLVTYGGFCGINLKAGETVIVAPATGGFSGAAVEVASAMGAKVIAAGRNAATLKRIAEKVPNVKTVQLTGDVEADAAAFQQFGQVDAFMEISPGTNTNPTHVKSALMALRPYGKVSLMGGLQSDFAANYLMIMFKSLTIRGQYMYERDDARGFVKLVESGRLKLGKGAGLEVVGSFSLDDWQKALEVAASNPEWGRHAVFIP